MPSDDLLTGRLTAPTSDPNERRVRAFYCFHESDCLPDDPGTVLVPVSRLPLLIDALVWDRDFFGFIDDHDRILQVRYDDEHASWVEIPSNEEHGSWGAYMSEAELLAFVAALPTSFTGESIPNAAFQAW